MNCYYHLERPAVAQCGKCGKFLCKECVVEGNFILCKDCFSISYQEYQVSQEQLRKIQKKHIRLSSIIFIISMVWFFMYFFMKYMTLSDANVLILIIITIIGAFNSLLFAGIPYGWRKLSETKLRGILVIPILGWLIYFTIKFQVAYWIGWFHFIKDLKNYRK